MEVQVPRIHAEAICQLAVGQVLPVSGAQRLEHT